MMNCELLSSKGLSLLDIVDPSNRPNKMRRYILYLGENLYINMNVSLYQLYLLKASNYSRLYYINKCRKLYLIL
jgi:hypothetical protein